MQLLHSPTHCNNNNITNHRSASLVVTTQSFRPRRMTSPPAFRSAVRLLAAKLSGIGGGHHHHQQQSIEHKMAELRAAYATQPSPAAPAVSAATTWAQQCSNGSGGGGTNASWSATKNGIALSTTTTTTTTQYKTAPPRRPGRTSLPTPSLGDTTTMLLVDQPKLLSRSCVPSRRASTVSTNCCTLPTPSIMDLASSAGLLSLSPSDLVFESSVLGIAYYDFVLSVSEVSPIDDGAAVTPGATVARRRHATALGTTATSGATATTLEPRRASCNRMLSPTPTKRRVQGTGSDPTPPSPTATTKAACTAPQRQQPQRKTSAVGCVLAKLTESGKKRTQATATSTAVVVTTTNGGVAPSDGNFSMLENVKLLEVREKVEEGSSDDDTASSAKQTLTVYRLMLAKLDQKTNVEWFESVLVPAELLERNGIPVNELSLLTMGILVWRCTLNNARLLCLVNGMQQQQHVHQDGNTTAASFEALKRAACKYKCMHHVLTIGQRRPSGASTHSSGSSSSRRSSTTSSIGSHMQHHYQPDSGMKLRVLMCQSRNELPELPAQALREAKFLLTASTNPLFCLCFPLT